MSEPTPRTIEERSFISIFITIGSLASSGSVLFMRSIFSLTSVAAVSMFVPSTNLIITIDEFDEDVEETVSTLLTVPTAFSIGFVTRFSISSGPAPT